MSYGKALHTVQHAERSVVVRKNPEFNEYRCRLFCYGEPRKEADYFTNDLDDAKSTAGHMARCTQGEKA